MLKATDTVALMLNVNTQRPLQAQLFDQVRAMIIDGQLKSGSALPATRALSEQLGVSRNTVVLAYDRLLSEGYIESKRSIGTFVSEAIPASGLLLHGLEEESAANVIENERAKNDLSAAQIIREHLKDILPAYSEQGGDLNQVTGLAPEIDFRSDFIDPDDFPTRSWRRILNRKCMEVEAYLNDGDDPMGRHDLRRAIADHLGPSRGILTSASEVMIISSAVEGRALLAQLLLAPGAPAIIESPSLRLLAPLITQYNATLHEIPVDEHGLLTTRLPKVDTAKAGGGMIYVTPSRQFLMNKDSVDGEVITNSGMTLNGMTLARRIKLLEWAIRSKIIVVEDEADSDFGYSGTPMTALKGLDNQGAVIYLGGFEKTMGSGIGIGFLVLPPELVASAAKLRQMMTHGPSSLIQMAMAAFIEGGAYDRHLRKLRKKYIEKRDLTVQQLTSHFGNVQISGFDSGLQLIWHVPKRFGTALKIASRARAELQLGLYVADTERQGLVFGFSALSPDEITDGIQRLSLMLNDTIGRN